MQKVQVKIVKTLDLVFSKRIVSQNENINLNKNINIDGKKKNEKPSSNVLEVRRSEWKKSKSDFFQAGYLKEKIVHITFLSVDTPTNYCEALKGDYCNVPKGMIVGKKNCFIKSQVSNFVKKPKNVKMRLKKC